MTLQSIGWSAFFHAHLPETTGRPCRVISDGGGSFLVHDGTREITAVARGSLRDQQEFPSGSR